MLHYVHLIVYNTGIAPLCTFECYSQNLTSIGIPTSPLWSGLPDPPTSTPTLTPTQTPFPILSSSTTYGINGSVTFSQPFAGDIYKKIVIFFRRFLWKCKLCLSDFIFISPCNYECK